ncbi:tyrosine-type recombinase/integrase [Streptomyces sp. NPDC058294]|uniref:tyrosine-type recombinase/integrase n=1 Tax=Streptomyces sp. NPDC058294 TaxID=3346430 RepID=UPI0036EB9F7F
MQAYTSLLRRVVSCFERPVWEIEPGEVDGMLGSLVAAGRAPGTRRQYLQMLRAFHAFLQHRYAAEIRVRFGVAVGDPLDAFNRLRHVQDEAPARGLPPTAERVAAFFTFTRARLATTGDYRAAARDYALLRTLYHSALRVSELVRLEQGDIHPLLGPSGKLHVRFGKAAKASGPRPRWTPMLDGLDRILAWYQADVRPLYPSGAPLFCDAQGHALKPGAGRDRLARLLDTEGCSRPERFTPHALRRACATHHYERGMDLLAVQQLLGHRHIASTMAYVRPSHTFIEDAWRRATAGALTALAI